MQITFDVPDNTRMINLEYAYRSKSGLGFSHSHAFAEDLTSGKVLKVTPGKKNVEQIIPEN